MMNRRMVGMTRVLYPKRKRREMLTTDCFGQARAMTRFFSIDLIVEITADVVVETGHALSLCIIFYPLKNVSSCRFCRVINNII